MRKSAVVVAAKLMADGLTVHARKRTWRWGQPSCPFQVVCAIFSEIDQTFGLELDY
jgi:hypothetical protein